MVLKTIYVTRHGFRSNWVVDRNTGTYSTSIPSPTGIASDPALAGYGVTQSQELAAYLSELDPPIQRFYSSPFYRCIQTLNPTLETIASRSSTTTDNAQDETGNGSASKLERPAIRQDRHIRGDPGLGEWYGRARFDHPSPAPATLLNSLFPRYGASHETSIVPSVNGESIEELHDRTAYALSRIVVDCDEAGVETIVLCTHAATLIAIGRALTGYMPEQVEEEDFRPFTCGVSKFERRKNSGQTGNDGVVVEAWKESSGRIPNVDWRNGNGIRGGWDCVTNGDCSFLSGGEERGWRFSGDESFLTPGSKDTGLDAGNALGVVVEGGKKKGFVTGSGGASHL